MREWLSSKAVSGNDDNAKDYAMQPNRGPSMLAEKAA